jgi:hypothetical protein
MSLFLAHCQAVAQLRDITASGERAFDGSGGKPLTFGAPTKNAPIENSIRAGD